MKILTELSQFVESEAFSTLDEQTKHCILSKYQDHFKDLCQKWNLPEEENTTSHSCETRYPDLFLGLKMIKVEDLPEDHVTKWVLGGDAQGLIPVIRSGGKYGLFRASFYGMGMGAYAYHYASEPFKFDDVRICVPYMGLYHYNGYLATLKHGEWSIWAIDIDTHPLEIVKGCKTFDEARIEMESLLGQPSPDPWMTFDGYDENDRSLWNM